MRNARRLAAYAAVLAIGILVGAVGRGFFPPFVLDDPFWRAFWSGAPAAGIFALAGAGVAFAAAAISARISRRNALRDQWWQRAEWALTQAMSGDPAAVDVGIAALEVLTAEATPTEGDMIAAVTSKRFLPAFEADVDLASPTDGQ